MKFKIKTAIALLKLKNQHPVTEGFILRAVEEHEDHFIIQYDFDFATREEKILRSEIADITYMMNVREWEKKYGRPYSTATKLNDNQGELWATN